MKVRSYYSKVLYAKEHEYSQLSDLVKKPFYHPIQSHYLLTSQHFFCPCPLSTTTSSCPSSSNHPIRKVSFSYVSEQFTRCVDRMESAILVPTKLQDLVITGDPSIPFLISSGHKTLYDIYHMLIKFRDKLQTVADQSSSSSNSSSSSLVIMGSSAGGGPIDTPSSTTSSCHDCEDLERTLSPFNVEETNAIYSYNPTNHCSKSNNNNNTINGQMVSSNTRSPSSVSSISLSGTTKKDGGPGPGDPFCDSGFWSSGSSSSPDSVTLSVLTPDGPSDPDVMSGLLSSPSSTTEHQHHHQSSGSHVTTSSSPSLTCSSGSSTSSTDTTCYVVKKSLNSAKGLCSFLVELSQVTYYVIDRYLDEMSCQFCE